jgi:hypothetical protein
VTTLSDCDDITPFDGSGKKGGKRHTVNEEACVNTITMINMFSCLQYKKKIKEWRGRREERGTR